MFSRITTIPFQRIGEFQTLQGSLKLKAALQDVLNKAVCSIGTIIELKDSFKNMKEDPLFVEICPLLEKSDLDMRSQLNYALLLFSTGKVVKDKWTYIVQAGQNCKVYCSDQNTGDMYHNINNLLTNRAQVMRFKREPILMMIQCRKNLHS